jgi:hypothetical protein
MGENSANQTLLPILNSGLPEAAPQTCASSLSFPAVTKRVRSG